MGKSELRTRRLAPEYALVLSPDDNVAVAIQNLAGGFDFAFKGRRITLRKSIPAGHKLALKLIRKGSAVLKYGHVIGFASSNIGAGEHVHVHNVTVRGRARSRRFTSKPHHRFNNGLRENQFLGFHRKNGRVGTRNYVLLIASTNCSASVCRQIAHQFQREKTKQYPNVDGVVALTHKSGCGMQSGGIDHQILQKTLAGYARHPNVFDYVLVGLGCEVNQLSCLLQNEGLVSLTSDSPPPRVVTIQDAGGFARAVTAGVQMVTGLLPQANECHRSLHPAADLIVGTECGGSDAYSGITANPALGVACDEIIHLGGTAILAETPEMYGAEHLLVQRASSQHVGQALQERIAWWKKHAAALGAELNNNPTPGNIEGGLTTIYEKSLGAIAKGGTSQVKAVYQYAESIQQKGLVIMDTPGHDPVSVTGMIAGGANVIVFTTGRGSVYGSVPAPCIKVATNTVMYSRMAEDMDLNAGTALEGQSVEDVGRMILTRILQTASGEKTASEMHGIGEEEFAPWAIGPVL